MKLNVVHYAWRALMVNQYSHEPLDSASGAAPGAVSVLGYFGAWRMMPPLMPC